MAEIFISYSRNERQLALPVNEALHDLGLDTFFDVHGIDAGDEFPDVIDSALRASKIVLALWSPYALTREWVRTEALLAKDLGILVPAEIQSLDPKVHVPTVFYSLHRTSLIGFDGDPTHEGWIQTISVISRKLDRLDLLERAENAAAAERSSREKKKRDALERDRQAEEERRREEEANEAASKKEIEQNGEKVVPRKASKYVEYE